MFSPGIYNPQRSSYVGSSLGEFMQVLPMVQERFDQSREMFDAIDAFVENIDHLQGDRDMVYQATQPYREAIESARESGDYRSLYGQAGKLSKKVINDKALKVAQQSYNNMMKQREMEAEFGVNALTFSNPDEHQSMTFDADGKPVYNVYTPRVELRKDYDKRMSDIYGILKADGFIHGLSEYRGEIEGFLQSGKTTALTSTKIRNYLDKAYQRYIESPEGVQDFERLVRIEGLDPTEASVQIQQRLLNVGLGMEFGDPSVSYQQNPMYGLAKQAKESYDQVVNYPGASPALVLPIKETIPQFYIEDGEIRTSFNFGETYQKHRGDRTYIPKLIEAGAKALYDGLTGKGKGKVEDPIHKIAIDNTREKISNMYNIDPSQVTNQQIVDYLNSARANPEIATPVGYSPIRDIADPRKKALYDTKYREEAKTIADSKKPIFSGGAFTSRRFVWEGEPISFETLMDKVPNARLMEIIGEFGNDNPFGMPGGGAMAQITDENNKTFRIPMEHSAEFAVSNPVNVVENMIHETKYNNLTGTNLKPRTVPGYPNPVYFANSGSELKLYDMNNPGKPVVKVGNRSNDPAFNAFFEANYEALSALKQREVSEEEMKSIYILQKLSGK